MARYTGPDVATYDALFVAAAAQEGVEPALVKAVCARESGFQPDAYHYDRAYEVRHGLAPDPALHASRGLMQIEGETARRLGWTGELGDDATRTGGTYDVYVNIGLGVRLLAENLRRARGAVEIAVAAYNAGWSTVRPDDAPRHADGTFVNQGYVDDVLANLARWRAAPLDPRPRARDDAPASDGPGPLPLVAALGLGVALLWVVARLVR